MPISVIIYTDGACLGNPGPGGWACILTHGSHRKEMCGGYKFTTNNRMELYAAIHGIDALKMPCQVEIVSDSQYLCKAIQLGWIYKWQANGFMKKGKPMPNHDLWRRISQQMMVHSITCSWVKGHSGHPENELCDAMAVKCASMPDLPPASQYGAIEAHSEAILA